MSSESALLVYSESQPNFVNLSLLICHLFAGGSFQVAHILYHPESFDDRLYNEIHLKCPFPIPVILDDITVPLKFRLNQNKHTDHILQLIFLPHKQSIQSLDGINDQSTIYRVFISTQDRYYREKLSGHLLEKLHRLANLIPSSLLVQNSLTGVVRCYLFSKDLKDNLEMIKVKNIHSNSSAVIFNSVFGKLDPTKFLGVAYTGRRSCEKTNKFFSVYLKVQKAIANLYLIQMNLSFMNNSIFERNGSEIISYRNLIRPIPRKFYTDFSFNYNPIGNRSKYVCQIIYYFEDVFIKIIFKIVF